MRLREVSEALVAKAMVWLRLRKVAAGLATAAGRRALARGVGASVEHRAVLRDLRARSVVDVGANRGQFALLCLALFPDARIVSFEPAAAAFAVLQAVTAAGRVRAVRAAIAPAEAMVALNITDCDDASSLLAVGPRQAAQFGTKTVRREPVRAAPLAAFVEPGEIVAPALLKIDVQGSELAVLQGCGALLGRFDAIYVECSYVELYQGQALVGDVVAFLAGAGFRLAGVFNQVAGDGEPAVQADFLFRR